MPHRAGRHLSRANVQGRLTRHSSLGGPQRIGPTKASLTLGRYKRLRQVITDQDQDTPLDIRRRLQFGGILNEYH